MENSFYSHCFLFPERILPAFLVFAGFAQERGERSEVNDAFVQPVA
jgi:hypothetical protein